MSTLRSSFLTSRSMRLPRSRSSRSITLAIDFDFLAAFFRDFFFAAMVLSFSGRRVTEWLGEVRLMGGDPPPEKRPTLLLVVYVFTVIVVVVAVVV